MAGECTLTLDMRILPNQTEDSVLSELKQIAQEANNNVSWDFKIRANHIPLRVPDNDPLVNSIVKITGARLKCIGGGTVSKVLMKNNIISVGCGPGSPDELKYYHAANERIKISSMVDFTNNIVKICEDFCNTPLPNGDFGQ